jgi:hypothetical protein
VTETTTGQTTPKETTMPDTTTPAKSSKPAAARKPATSSKAEKPKRTRTEMTAPDGRRHVASSPTEVNNLLSAGYKLAEGGK